MVVHGQYLRSLPFHTPNDEGWLLQNKGHFVSLYQSPLAGIGHYFYEYQMKHFIDNMSNNTIKSYNSTDTPNTVDESHCIVDQPSIVSFSPPI